MSPAGPQAELAAYIETMIASGVFASGAKLPTQRKLGEQFGLPQSAVCLVLKELEKRGLLELRQGSGCYVLRKAAARGKYTFLVYSISEPGEWWSYCGNILVGMQDRAAELGIGLAMNFMEYGDLANSPLRKLEANFDAVVLVGLYDNDLTEFSCRKPCVGVNMHQSFDCLSTLDMDPVAAAKLAVSYLRRKNVRHAICISLPGFTHEGEAGNVLDFRRQCFLAAWRGTSECISLHESDDFSRLARLPEGTGLWFAADTACQKILKGYRAQTGRDLLDEVPIISNNGRNRISPKMFHFPTIGPDYRLMGRCAVDEAVRRIEQPGAPLMRLYQNVTLQE